MTLICILEAHVSSKNAQGVGKRIKKAQCAFHVHYLVSIVIPILTVKTVLCRKEEATTLWTMKDQSEAVVE